jgi:hypothetical protein
MLAKTDVFFTNSLPLLPFHDSQSKKREQKRA